MFLKWHLYYKWLHCISYSPLPQTSFWPIWHSSHCRSHERTVILPPPKPEISPFRPLDFFCNHCTGCLVKSPPTVTRAQTWKCKWTAPLTQGNPWPVYSTGDCSLVPRWRRCILSGYSVSPVRPRPSCPIELSAEEHSPRLALHPSLSQSSRFPAPTSWGDFLHAVRYLDARVGLRLWF